MSSFNISFKSTSLNKVARIKWTGGVMMGYVKSILEIIGDPLTFHFAWHCGFAEFDQ